MKSLNFASILKIGEEKEDVTLSIARKEENLDTTHGQKGRYDWQIC